MISVNNELTVHCMHELIVPARGVIFELMVQTDEDKVRQAFAGRLNKALDDVDAAPNGHGRAKWLATEMEVSPKGAGKWLNGEALPELAKLPKLSGVAQCNPVWLLFGDDKTQSEIREPGGTYASPPTPHSNQIHRKLATLETEKKLSKQLLAAIDAVINAASPANAFPASQSDFVAARDVSTADLGLDDDPELVDLTEYLQNAVAALKQFRARRQPQDATAKTEQKN